MCIGTFIASSEMRVLGTCSSDSDPDRPEVHAAGVADQTTAELFSLLTDPEAFSSPWVHAKCSSFGGC